MSQYYPLIIEAFLKGEEPKNSWINRVRVRSSQGGRRENWQLNGRARLSVRGTELLSYERFTLASRLPDGRILLNADAGPSMTTREQMRELHTQVEAQSIPHAYVPVSALDAARVYEHRDIEVIATTPARWIDRPCEAKWCDEPRPHGHEWSRDHFLGELLFRYDGRVFVSGIDRNDFPRRRYYLVRLPRIANDVTTVDEALEALRPNSVPVGSPRQGEWFFVPIDFKPKGEKFTRVPIVSASGKDEIEFVRPIVADRGSDKVFAPWSARERADRHIASTLIANGEVFVKGIVTDFAGRTFGGKPRPGHVAVRLPTWHCVVRNLGDGSWQATDVFGRGGVD